MDSRSSDEQQGQKILTPSAFLNSTVLNVSEVEKVTDSSNVFDEDSASIRPLTVPGYENMQYIPFGIDDRLPKKLLETIGQDEVLSQNLFFNILTAYGNGLGYMDAENKPTRDPEIRRFMLQNSMKRFYLEQSTDMKHFFFCVAVIILDRQGKKIVQVRHKDAQYCRFEKADKKGRVNHVFYADWYGGSSLQRKDVEVITLLDEINPLGHLEQLMGIAPGPDGRMMPKTTERKFAVVMRFPTPGQRYYPSPYYAALFRGDWFDLKRLIGKAKKSKLRNHTSMRYQVEIHDDYWNRIMLDENIVDPVKVKERKEKEIRNIQDFVMGMENAGKVWVSGYFIDAYGKEQRMVRINVIDTGKEGGDWNEDVQEASNMVCYGTNIHPNLVGAVPGKSQSNNSGSDKRELFTLKQALETAFHDMMLQIHEMIIMFNGWEDKVTPQVPMILLTTLDKKTDAKKVNSDGTQTDPNN